MAHESYCGHMELPYFQRRQNLKWTLCSEVGRYTFTYTIDTINISGHFKIDSLEAKETHFSDLSSRLAAHKGTDRSQSSARDICPNDNSEKLARDT